MTSPAIKTRRNVFIKKSFQGRFIVTVLALILLSGLCSSLLIYWITGADLQAQTQSAHVNIANASERLGISLLIGNLISVLVAGGIAVFAVLYASHKIAGPLYRFETLCWQIGNGNLDTITQLRTGDQLQELSTAFADMVTQLRANRDRQSAQLVQLQRTIGDLHGEPNLNDQQRATLRGLAEAIATLNQRLG